MVNFSKRCGRIRVNVTDEGARMHEYGYGVSVGCVAGYNDSCPMVEHKMSVDELRDLQYLIGRAIEAATVTRL